MKYLVLTSFAAVFGLVLVLSGASSNSDFFARDFSWLLIGTAVLIVAMLSLIVYQIVQLRRRIRAGMFGAKLTVRLLLVFGVMALVPGTVVYAVSVQFMARSIESWFDVRVDHALQSGLNLGQTALDNLQHDLNGVADSMAQRLAETPPARQGAELNTLRELYGVQQAAMFTEHGGLISFSGGEGANSLPPAPDGRMLAKVRQQHVYSQIEDTDQGLYIRVVVPVNVLSITETMRVLQLYQPVPARLAADANAVRAANQDYQSLSLSRVGLKRLYGMTLTLTTLLTLLSTVALAFLISEQISAPLRALVRGTRAVAQGDFSQMHPVNSRDELGLLTQSFNRMTRQLADARNVAEERRAQIEKSHAYLETVLASLTSGVITFDEQGRVRGINPAAEHMLGIQPDRLVGLLPLQWPTILPGLATFAAMIHARFHQVDAVDWQQQTEFGLAGVMHTLLVRGSRLPAGMDSGFVLVLDDITGLLRAQRDAAWGEVARRLAHEIKNPLTPIQLSAERIEHKLADRLAPADAEILHRATRTIVNQVSAMKDMVNAFADYARTPVADMHPVRLNGLVREVLELYGHESMIRVQLADHLPEMQGDPRLLRQVVHNLLQNAQDASAGQADPQIIVATRLDGQVVELSVCDNGSGLSPHVRDRLFEPYATTKTKGTGLGLAIVKKIVEEHGGTITLDSRPEGGVVARVRFAVVPQQIQNQQQVM